jgi:hypothetical protein
MTANHRRNRIVIAAALFAVAALVLGISRVASPADAAKARHARLSTWAPLAAEAAGAAGLDPATVRSVAAGGTGRSEAHLVSANSRSGGACFAVTAFGESSSFSCRRPDAKEALTIRVIYGGTSLDAVDHVTLVGVARGDAASVSVVTTDGTVQRLALNRSRGFGYAANDSASLPIAVAAYARNGTLLQRVDLGSFTAPG